MRAAIYCRLSKKPEIVENIQQQRARGLALVAERGWSLVRNGSDEAFVDDGVSAFKEDAHRPGWLALLERCAVGEVDVIVARDSDRLSRNWDDFARLVRSSAKVATWAEGGGEPVDPDDTEGAVRAMMGRSYSKTLSKNRALAEERRVARGAPPPGGRRHFGYHSGTCCEEWCQPHSVHEAEAAVIREMAPRWLSGESLRSLASELTERGVRHTSGKAFNYGTLKRVLISPRIAALRVHLGVEVEGNWEPIIDRVLHDRLAAADSRRKSHRSPERYLLTGLMRCGFEDCGKTVNGHTHTQTNARRYKCLHCNRNGIRADTVEEAVWNQALGKTWHRDRRAEKQVAARLTDAERDLRAARSGLDELDDEYWQERAIPKRTYTRQATALRDRIAALEDEARRLRREREQAAGFWISLMAMAETYESATRQQRRAILDGAIRRVVLYPSTTTAPHVDLSRIEVEWRDGEVTRGDSLLVEAAEDRVLVAAGPEQ